MEELVPGEGPDGGAAIHADAVTMTFDTDVTALAEIDLEIERGEFVSIVGPSGCGKSTFLRIVAGLVEATSGSVAIGGVPVAAPRQDVALMFQKPTLLAWKTALENVLLPLSLKGGANTAELRRGLETLRHVGLAGFEHSFPQQLSGGMQQRVALARLLMTGAPVRLLDEPFAAVDELTREHLNLQLLEIHERSRGTTVLVTHNLMEATLLADRVVVMTARPGRIALDVSVPLPRPRTPEVIRTQAFQDLVFQARSALQLRPEELVS